MLGFHGSLGGLPPVGDKIIAKVLVANGADDPFVGADSIDMFREDMDFAGADYMFINYPGAKHSFTNPDANSFGEKFGLPLEYTTRKSTRRPGRRCRRSLTRSLNDQQLTGCRQATGSLRPVRASVSYSRRHSLWRYGKCLASAMQVSIFARRDAGPATEGTGEA